MDLKKGSSHDFDLMAENKGIAMGDSENLTLVLQKYEPYPITIIILPEEGRARIKVYFRELRQTMVFEIPLGLAREMSVPFEWALGLLRKMEGLEISVPLTRTLKAVCLLLEQPLKINPIKLEIAVSDTGKTRYGIEWKGEFGRSRTETVRTLKALLKLFKEED